MGVIGLFCIVRAGKGVNLREKNTSPARICNYVDMGLEIGVDLCDCWAFG